MATAQFREPEYDDLWHVTMEHSPVGMAIVSISGNVVTANAEFVGGVIAPGLNISAEALFARAARLPRVDIRRPDRVIGTNTVVNMQSGIYFGYLGLVDGILARIKREVPELKRVIATGGLAAQFADDSEHIEIVDPELTLKGLKLIYDRNRRRTRK